MQKLKEALEKAGIPMPSKDTETFRIVRWGRNNKYWLRKFEGGYVFGDFTTGLSSHVFEQNFRGKRLEEARESQKRAYIEVENMFDANYDASAKRADEIWKNADQNPCTIDYLRAKKVPSYRLRVYNNCLVVPIYDVNGKLWSLQFIDSAGNKKFLVGGRKKGNFFVIDLLANVRNVLICEGYATGATLHKCTGLPVVVAFDAGNLLPVAEALHKKYSNLRLIFCADNDLYNTTGINVGVEKATEAARLVNGEVVIPEFEDTSSKPTDFNDLMLLEGEEAVRKALEPILNRNKDLTGIEVPVGFCLTNSGLYCEDPRTRQQIRISNYVRVVAFTKTSDEVARLVEFRDYLDQIQHIIAKYTMFAKDGEQVLLSMLKKGFVYSGTLFSKRKLMEYISSSVPHREIIMAAQTGFSNGVYVRPDCVIGRNSKEIVVDSSLKDDAYQTAGTLQQWNEHVAYWCVGNSRLVFAISAGFASLLLQSCELSNFGFHFVGNSSSGKTTCLRLAASVFGTPKYVVTWKATDNAMENMAFKRNDSLLILDELSEISPSKAGEVAYMLANGQGKKRLDKECNAKETFSWRLIFLSSGEVDLNSHMAEENKTSKAGQKIRLLNISAKSSKGSFGIFENLRGFKDGADFSNFLRGSAAKYYGTSGIAFIQEILKSKHSIRDDFNEKFQKLKEQHLPIDAEGQDMRAFEHFMFVGFAGELAIERNVVHWAPGTAYDAAITCFNSWLEDKEGVGNDEDKQILEHVKSFFELHAHSRFYDLGGVNDQKISNMAGYKSVSNGSVTFFVSPSVFQNEICGSFNRKAVILLLIEKGFLLKDHNGDYRQQKWTPYGNKKVYVISGDILLG